MAKTAGPKAPTKTEVLNSIATATGLSKKEVMAVMDAIVSEVSKALGKKGAGVFTIPGLCKIIRQNKPAQPSRQVRNPATGEMVMSKPKPARNVVKDRKSVV